MDNSSDERKPGERDRMRGLRISRRIIRAACSGPAIGLLYTLLTTFLIQPQIGALGLMTLCTWRIFVLTIFITIGALANEIFEKDPDIR